MKTFYKVMRVIAIIAAIIGIVYVVAAYGDKIVAWARKTIGKIFGKRGVKRFDHAGCGNMDNALIFSSFAAAGNCHCCQQQWQQPAEY